MKTKSLDTPTIDELKKIVYDLRIGGKPKSGFITDNDLEKIDNATQAILQWHKSKARSYVFKLVGKRCEEYEELCPVCEAWGLLDQTLKSIEESK